MVAFFWSCWFWPRFDTQPCRDTWRTEAHLKYTTGSKARGYLANILLCRGRWHGIMKGDGRTEEESLVGGSWGEGRAYRRSKAPGAERTRDKDHRTKEEALGRSTRVHLLSKDPKATLLALSVKVVFKMSEIENKCCFYLTLYFFPSADVYRLPLYDFSNTRPLAFSDTWSTWFVRPS